MFASKLKCIWKCTAHRRQRWSFRVSLNISCETAWAASWLCFRSKSLSNFPIANFHRDIRRNFLAVSNLQSPGSVEAKTSTFVRCFWFYICSEWVSHWPPLKNMDTNGDFRDLRLFRHLIRVISGQKDSKREFDIVMSWQFLVEPGSFALLQCFRFTLIKCWCLCFHTSWWL